MQVVHLEVPAYRYGHEQVMAKGLCERIGIEGSNLQHTNVAKNEKTKIEKPMKDHGDAIQMVIDALC